MLLTRGRSPYLYCLLQEDCLYIGMTIQNPIIRWASSIRGGGSFQQAIERYIGPLNQSEFMLHSVCYECTDVRSKLMQEEWRTATCFAEHLLHELFSANRFILGREIILISDTVRTAPRRCRHRWVEDEAESAFEYFVQCLTVIATTS